MDSQVARYVSLRKVSTDSARRMDGTGAGS